MHISVDGLTLWPSTVAEGSWLSTSDPKAVRHPIFYSLLKFGHVYINGVELLDYSIVVFRLSSIVIVALSCSQASEGPLGRCTCIQVAIVES